MQSKAGFSVREMVKLIELERMREKSERICEKTHIFHQELFFHPFALHFAKSRRGLFHPFAHFFFSNSTYSRTGPRTDGSKGGRHFNIFLVVEPLGGVPPPKPLCFFLGAAAPGPPRPSHSNYERFSNSKTVLFGRVLALKLVSID